MSLPFVPRKVTAKSKSKSTSSAADTTRPSTLLVQDTPQPKSVSTGNSLTERDYACLVNLALSDYALFSDLDLRRKLDENDDKFISLFSVLETLSLPEAPVAKALRALASNSLEVRMVLSRPVWSSWKAQDTGMFEVRRKIAPVILSHYEWKRRTIYIENIPVQSVSVHGIFHLVQSCLPSPAYDRIQGVTFLSHHLDRPGDTPKPKPFAFVTLLRLEDVEHMLRDWPWERMSSPTSHTEAAKFGMRAISRERWDLLKAEFLAHRTDLVTQMVAEQDTNRKGYKVPPIFNKRARTRTRTPSPSPAPCVSPPQGTLSLDSPFPPNCLMFVKNVHMGTNKTTLRALFSQAFPEGHGIDYVDFNKGMDTCHLRLSTPEATHTLHAWFTENRIVQTTGLDGSGTAGQRHIEMEIVRGRQEELYWEKVPLKVRKDAVIKALGAERDKHEEKKRRRKR